MLALRDEPEKSAHALGHAAKAVVSVSRMSLFVACSNPAPKAFGVSADALVNGAMDAIIAKVSADRAVGVLPAKASADRATGILAAETLAGRAVGVLVAEALLTPKPALVDRRGSGAHRDLDLTRLLRSALSLREGFRRMAVCAEGRAPSQLLREELASIGREAEQRMLAATGGSNAHRGAIWILGLLVAARMMCGETTSAGEVADMAAQIARLPDRFAPAAPSNGSRVCDMYGVAGARGEAQAGFPHVIAIGLPALRRAREQAVSETHAQLDALMAIMAHLPDTCLLHRGGLAALRAAQAGARAVVDAGGTATAEGWGALLALDADLLERWASPGGCADLLAACLFLDGGDQWKN